MTTMLDPWIWLVYALAVARVTGLVTVDTVTEPIRDWIVVRLDDAEGSLGARLAYLITCPWCASVWIGAVAAPIVYNWGSSPWLLVPALALALSFVAGATSNLGR
jgi:hypothetical protein